MDQPLEAPADIYQIHRTPYFKRLHRNDSDQFERLKKAYESIRSFDEKPLQIQIKKVRLDKLLRHIKDSLPKAKQPNPENRPIRPRPKSKQEIRNEEIIKARQVGIEYSRQNFNSTTRLIKPKNIDPNENLLMKKSQLSRRLNYGNAKSEKNRSKIHQRNQGFILSERKEFTNFPSIASSKSSETREKLRKLLVDYIFEDNPNADVVDSLAEIATTKNHLYWDLMGAIRKQQQYIKRYGKFTKMLSNLAKENYEQHQNISHEEVFQSKTNIRSCGSEVLIKTFRYSDDDDEHLPLPSESFLVIPIDLPHDDDNEIPTRDELDHLWEQSNESDYFIKHLHMSLASPASNSEPKFKEQKFDLSHKFGEIIRETVRKESAIMLTNLERAMKH